MQWCSTSNQKPFAQQVWLLQSFQNVARSIPKCFSSTSRTSFREFAVVGRLKWLHTSESSQAWEYLPVSSSVKRKQECLVCALAPESPSIKPTATCRNGEPYPEPTERSNHRQ
jgi:hypothetical protein